LLTVTVTNSKMVKCILFFLITVCFSSTSWVANDISGVWINADKDAHIKLYSSYGKYYGQVVWMKQPIDSATGKPQLDKFNGDPKLRTRPVMNMIVLKDLVFDAKDQQWEGGTIYNPKAGNTFDLFCKMIDKNTLEMHFYLTVTTIGKTFNWKRVTP
jgi:uncharacterized protein (DUF2147 family)